MASINVSELDFKAVAWAAYRAKQSGSEEEAQVLDKLAHKINAALSMTRGGKSLSSLYGFAPPHITWKDVPSVLAPEEGLPVPELRTYLIKILRSSIVVNPGFGTPVDNFVFGRTQDILDDQGNVTGQRKYVPRFYEIGCPTASFGSRPFLYRTDPDCMVTCRFCGDTFRWGRLVDTFDYPDDDCLDEHVTGSDTTCPTCEEEDCCSLRHEAIEEVFGSGEWYRYTCPDCGKLLPPPEDPRTIAGWVPEELRIVPAPGVVYFCLGCVKLKEGNWRPVEETLTAWKARVINKAREAR